MENRVEVIGIDHGWSGMKTVHEVFTSGCKEISTEPAFTENLLEFGGKYYKIGSRRLEVKDTKVTDERDWAKKIQHVTNRLCEEYRLFAIEIKQHGGKQNERYKDWNEFRDGKFIWRKMIQRDVDA